MRPSARAGAEVGGVAADRYLQLMKACLTRLLFIDEEVAEVNMLSRLGWDPTECSLVRAALEKGAVRLVRRGADESVREAGRDWPPPPTAETMIGLRRLDNVQECLTDVIAQRIPGDVIEAGVWRGGTTIFMRAILIALGESARDVWVADSFQGVPVPDPHRYPADAGLDHFSRVPQLVVDLEQVRTNFSRYGLLDSQVRFLPGLFKDTLAFAPIDQLALVRVDCDLYESTMDALSALYPKLSPGGYVIIDDYNHIEACRRATNDYRASQSITEDIVDVDWTAVYWRKLR